MIQNVDGIQYDQRTQRRVFGDPFGPPGSAFPAQLSTPSAVYWRLLAFIGLPALVASPRAGWALGGVGRRWVVGLVSYLFGPRNLKNTKNLQGFIRIAVNPTDGKRSRNCIMLRKHIVL